MNAKILFLNLSLIASLIGHASCQQAPHQTSVTSYTTKTDSFTEGFEQEQAAKSSYAAAGVKFNTGKWILDDALLAASKADAMNGSHSIRIRNNGRLSMQFDVNGVTGVNIEYAAYGNDGASSWQLWASDDEGETYKQVGKTIVTTDHSLKKASFTINYSHVVRLEIRKVSGGKNRINIDDFTAFSTGSPVIVSSGTSAGTAKKEVIHTFSNSNLLLGNPSLATNNAANADNYLIDHQYYVESYNRNKGEPNWVSWHIGADDLGNTDRLNNFRADETLPEGWYVADNTSYRGCGFDKGHNCPSGDRTSSIAANSATFLMDNIIPQAPNNNQRTWEHLESYCRDKVKKGNEVYVIMGNYGSGGTGKNGYVTSIDNGRINVPSNIWKVVVIVPEGNNDLQRINANTIVIAIDTPNDNSITPNWMNYLCTVRDIEKATGYNLLSALPKDLQEVIELKKFKGGN